MSSPSIHKKGSADAFDLSQRASGLFLASLPIAVYACSNDGHITWYNDMAIELWGREPNLEKDLYSGAFRILDAGGSVLDHSDSPMALCLKHQRPVFGMEVIFVRPDGSFRHVAPHPKPMYDEQGNMVGGISVLTDITRLKLQEKALKASEERYYKMIEEVEDYAIILLDKDGIIRQWNKGAEKIKGYREDEIVGKSFSEFYLPKDQDSNVPAQFLQEARTKGKSLYEGWRKRKDGSLFWGSVVLTALHNDEGGVIGFSKVTRDLTAIKQADDKQRSYLAQLEFKNKELEQFVYAASHDMKEPLRKIHLYNTYIASSPTNILEQKSKEFLSRSINAVERMTGLIDDLLSYARITSVEEGFTQVDLNLVMEEIAAFHKDDVAPRKIHIRWDKLPVITGIPFQVKQLFSNLIDNAVKYRHPDREAQVYVSAELTDGVHAHPLPKSPVQHHKIRVSDNGIGFDMAHAKRIFEIFQRLVSSSTANGSGIGLAICKKIVQNHNGIIEAAGVEGEGADFTIFLPAE